MSRSVLTPFVLGNVCAAALIWVAGGLLAPRALDSGEPISEPAAEASAVVVPDGPPVAAALPEPGAAAPPKPPAAAEQLPEDVVDREPEGESTSWVISATLLREAQARAKRVHQALAGLAGTDSAVGVQLDVYQNALRDNLAGLPLPEVAGTREAMVEAFLWTDSVQEEFATMNPASRQGELNFIRRELGFSDEEIQALTRNDAAREARWQNGLAYMKERYRAGASFEGEGLKSELERLRVKFFGDEASTIANEERDGFFRYEGQRIYGVN